MKNCLVTGGSGFLGSSMIERLKNAEEKVISVERDQGSNPFTRVSPNVTVRGDIRDYNFIRRIIADYEIEEVYHFASQAIVKTCANDPYTTYDINVMGTVSLLEACRNSGTTVKNIIISTSDKAFGHSDILPYTEKTPLNPLYTYETSKTCQQLIALSYFHNYGIPTKIVACSNIYGPGDPNITRIVPNTILNLLHNKSAMLNEGVAEYIREFIYITDVIDAFIRVARFGTHGEVYCCGGTGYLTIFDLIAKICALLRKDPEKNITFFKKVDNFKEIDKQWIDSSKLKSIGWKPNISLDEGLKLTIEYYSNFVG
jgi:CDP-glucose 4,6-dehydratase